MKPFVTKDKLISAAPSRELSLGFSSLRTASKSQGQGFRSFRLENQLIESLNQSSQEILATIKVGTIDFLSRLFLYLEVKFNVDFLYAWKFEEIFN